MIMIDMDLPESCAKCRFCSGCDSCEGFDNYCTASENEINLGYFYDKYIEWNCKRQKREPNFTPYQNRHKDCPLIEVTEHE